MRRILGMGRHPCGSGIDGGMVPGELRVLHSSLQFGHIPSERGRDIVPGEDKGRPAVRRGGRGVLRDTRGPAAHRRDGIAGIRDPHRGDAHRHPGGGGYLFGIRYRRIEGRSIIAGTFDREGGSRIHPGSQGRDSAQDLQMHHGPYGPGRDREGGPVGTRPSGD